MDDKARKIFVTIKSPEKVFFDGEAKALSSVNEKGKFDILPYHENFITIVNTTLLVHGEGEKTQEFQIDSGILKAWENKVQVFLGIETFQAEELRAEALKQSQKTEQALNPKGSDIKSQEI